MGLVMPSAYAGRDHATLLNVVAPFLSRNAKLLQIDNETYRYRRPGDGACADPDLVILGSASTDHTPFLENQEFIRVMVQKLDSDLRDHLCSDMTSAIRDNFRLIGQEPENAS